MVRMGDVWDRAVEVLRGRTGILAWIAAVALFVPTVVNAALSGLVQTQARTGTGMGLALLAAVVAIAVLVLSIWGQLALLAVATHPETTRDDATRQATRRLGAGLAVVVVLVLVLFLALVPPIVALIRGGLNPADPATFQSMPPSATGFAGLYLLVLAPIMVWLGARLVLVNPVILNEGMALGAIARSFRLTRGLTWRIIGVMVLFVVVLLVATLAVQGVTALLFRLLLGGQSIALVAFLAQVAGAVVTSAFSVVAAAFTAQLYVAAAGERARLTETFS